MTPGLMSPWRLLVVAFLVSSLPGGALAADDSRIERASAFAEQGDYRAAEIELKDLLQSDPGLIQARRLLGSVYLRLGDGATAEKEIRRAMQLGAGDAQLTLDLAEALLQQGRFSDALELLDIDSAPPEERAALLGMRGRALAGQGQLDEARAAFAEALDIDPNDRIAGLGLAQLALLADDADEAAETSDRFLTLYPEDTDLMLLRAEIFRRQGKPEAALEQFAGVLARESANLRALIGQATVLVGLQRFDEAQEDLDRVERIRPGIVITSYLRGVMAFYARDWETAGQHLDRVLSVQPNHPQSLLLMGIVSYARNDLQIAEEHLSRFMMGLPDNVQAAKVLAATRLKMRKPDEAVAVLEPFVGAGDPQIMALLGSAYLLAGDQVRGQDWLSRAVETAPDVAALRTQLALTLIAGGHMGEAIDELESAVDLGQDVLQADVLLVLALLKEGQYDEAVAASEALEERRADSPIPYNLTGLALLSQGRLDRARAKFERALEIDPSFSTGLINLARVDIAADDLDAATGRYQDVLARDPKNLAALLGLAALAERRDDPQGLEQWLNRAQDANPSSTQPGILLARYNIGRGEHIKALTIASDLAARFPQDAEVLEMLGRAQTLSGEEASAIRSFEQVAEQRPDDPQIYYLLGGAQWKQEDYGAAARSFRRAIALKPDYVQARVALASVLVAAESYDEAVAVARGLQQDYPDDALGWRLEGVIQIDARNLQAAVPPLERALSLAPNGDTVRRLAELYSRAGDTDKAIDLLQRWSTDNADDLQSRSLLAMLLQREGRDDDALPIYEDLYEQDQTNVIVLNNLAWILHQRGDARAQNIAREAYDLEPSRPEVADTLGWILYNSGHQNEGLNILQQAHLAYPTQTEIAYHVAAALDGVGRSDEAIHILRKLLRDYPNAPEASDARALMQRLAPDESG